jgi:hypothetical protein
MCKPHWNQYTTALRKAALAAKAAEAAPEVVEAVSAAIEAKPRRAKGNAPGPVAESGEADTE